MPKTNWKERTVWAYRHDMRPRVAFKQVRGCFLDAWAIFIGASSTTLDCVLLWFALAYMLVRLALKPLTIFLEPFYYAIFYPDDVTKFMDWTPKEGEREVEKVALEFCDPKGPQ